MHTFKTKFFLSFYCLSLLSYSNIINAQDLNMINESSNQEMHQNINNINNMSNIGEHKVFKFQDQQEQKIICAPMRVCLIKLAPYEKIIDQFIGDSIRWEIVSYDNIKNSFVAIKPQKAFLKTNYIIIGSVRTYYFNLESDTEKYMNSVSFIENNALYEKYEKYETNKENQAYKNNINIMQKNTYKIIGNADFKPTDIKIIDNKTYIYLPKNINELPIFIAKTDKGEMKAVNARWLDHYYMIDEVIKKGELVKGVGRYQEKIEIIQDIKDKQDMQDMQKNEKIFKQEERN